uniref:Uncharacterized protein n=1 Tax=Ciona intestinalis TaxID=7719 RepID=F6SE45_CIOIN
PNCKYNKKWKVKRSLFAIKHPEFAKNKEEREYRTELRKIILSLRDPNNKDDTILDQLHKESQLVSLPKTGTILRTKKLFTLTVAKFLKLQKDYHLRVKKPGSFIIVKVI